MVTLDISVDPHIKKFVESEYAGKDGIVDIGLYNYVCQNIYSHIQTAPRDASMKRPQEPVITVRLGTWLGSRKGSHYLRQQAHENINEYFCRLFTERLHVYLDAKMEMKELVKVKIKDQVIRFLGKYEITEGEYSLDRGLKSYYRHRQRSEAS